MSGKYFIDTNIFIYAFDSKNPEKQDRANRIIKAALDQQNGCISYQVVQEFINVTTRKFAVPLSVPECKMFLENVLYPLCDVFSSFDLYLHSLDIMDRWKFGFYDSLIIAAAIQADCTILYSEDLQHNQKIQQLTIINPFQSIQH